MKRTLGTISLMLTTVFGFAQYGYWQQHASYQMEIDMDVEKNQYTGKQK
ncbi:MAG: hypothetical protein ACI8VL_001326, partial [Bacteroidia bacterium]